MRESAASLAVSLDCDSLPGDCDPGNKVLNIGVGAGFFEKEALARSIDGAQLGSELTNGAAYSVDHLGEYPVVRRLAIVKKYRGRW